MKLIEWYRSRDYKAVHADIRKIGVALIQAGALGTVTDAIIAQFSDKGGDWQAAAGSVGVIVVGVVIWVIGWPKDEDQQ
jgi:lipoprotein signal peptidase